MRPLASFAGGAASVGLVVGALAVAGVIDDDRPAPAPASRPVEVAAVDEPDATVADIYRRVSPAVVFVQANSGRGRLPFPGGGQAASGSGFVVDHRGFIVTNEHVVDGANQFRVRFGEEGDPVTAELRGKDASTDLAVLKVDPDDVRGGLPAPLVLGSLGDVHPGDTTIAIGSPFGLQGTVTTGIVSALGRPIRAPNGFTIADAVQTDAAINPGNSGGPLLDGAGRVIGVNSQIRTEGGGNSGIGFAVPVSAIRSVLPRLERGQAIERAYLGVSTGDAPGGGAQVSSVAAGGPAARGGLRRGDVIVRVAERPVAASDDLSAIVAAREPGERVPVLVERGGDRRTLTVELGTRPDTPING
jgi:S1-C subfamily serine protease